ncbi:bcmo-2 [Pristionchus pacificus]|uniref:Bcmo-2 n=1 Tax=Pristionchus pacificus TaxID=54126 RepID=A0A2A6CWM8_PRIPA|nr:bcmo-2 [Pristionchus pacificus]|eukprot:PDM82632.1 bcmo-2 [Pristionchus pacificus]
MPELGSLLKNFEDVIEEKECRHEGSPIPAYLKGTMLRNGPGIFKWGDSEYNHWFDGDAYVQRYAFREGKMFYSARAIETITYLKNKKADRIVIGAFGTKAFPDPCMTLFQRLASWFQPTEITDNASVAFQELGDAVYALTEVPKMVPISTENLDVGDTIHCSKELFAVHTATAHCHYDREGNVYNMGSRFGKQTQYVIVKMSPKKEAVPSGAAPFDASLVASVDHAPEGPAYYHSFGMSENYFILMESPLRFNMLSMMMNQLFRMRSYQSTMEWKEGVDTTVMIVDRRTGEKLPVKMQSEPFFTFHHANSFERDGYLVMDYAKYKRAENLDGVLLENMRKPEFFNDKDENFTPYFHRMIVPFTVPEGAAVGENLLKSLPWAGGCRAELREDGSLWLTDDRLSEYSVEFPRYNYDAYNAKKYRFVYGTTILRGDPKAKNGIVKIDCDEKKTLIWTVDNDNQLTGEPIFVADPEGKKEDDGVLTVPVMTLDGTNPYVVILRATDLGEVARYIIPTDRIPFGFHGHYTTKHTTERKADV